MAAGADRSPKVIGGIKFVDGTTSRRQFHMEALDILPHGKIVPIIRVEDWELLAEVVRLAEVDAPLELAATDPMLLRAWREAVTTWHLKGWGGLEVQETDRPSSHVEADEQAMAGTYFASFTPSSPD